VEFVALNDVNAFNLENALMGLSENGMVFVQSHRTDPQEIWDSVPAWARQAMNEKTARLFALDTVAIAKEVSSRADLVQRSGMLETTTQGYGFLVEVLYRCVRAGARVLEVPIIFADRQFGKSKLSKAIMFEAMLLPWRLRFGR
jgi:hypothetical protein